MEPKNKQRWTSGTSNFNQDSKSVTQLKDVQDPVQTMKTKWTLFCSKKEIVLLLGRNMNLLQDQSAIKVQWAWLSRWEQLGKKNVAIDSLVNEDTKKIEIILLNEQKFSFNLQL
jgi:hypothetical protein